MYYLMLKTDAQPGTHVSTYTARGKHAVLYSGSRKSWLALHTFPQTPKEAVPALAIFFLVARQHQVCTSFKLNKASLALPNAQLSRSGASSRSDQRAYEQLRSIAMHEPNVFPFLLHAKLAAGFL